MKNIIYRCNSTATPSCFDVYFELILDVAQPVGPSKEECVSGKVNFRNEVRNHDLRNETNWLSPKASKELDEFCARNGCESQRDTFLAAIVDSSRIAIELEQGYH